jgi:CRISPR/Cas system-associated endonuclease Cas1
MQIHITTYGTYLHVKDAMFDIKRRGEDGKIASVATYSAEKVTHILLATGTLLSTDAVKLAMRHNVDIVFLERDGDPLGRVWHTKLVAPPVFESGSSKPVSTPTDCAGYEPGCWPNLTIRPTLFVV